MNGQQDVSQTPLVPVKKRNHAVLILTGLFAAILFFLVGSFLLSQKPAPQPTTPTPTIAPSTSISSPTEIQEIENPDGKACGPNAGGVCPG